MANERSTEAGGDGTRAGLGAKLLILVVERDPFIRELEAHFLQLAGYGVDFAADGHQALAHAQKVIPDVIISEILVPGLDGLSLCRRLKSEPETRGISIVIFSILAAAERAREAGADAFLLKPLAEKKLMSTVQGLLDARTQLKGTTP